MKPDSRRETDKPACEEGRRVKARGVTGVRPEIARSRPGQDEAG